MILDPDLQRHVGKYYGKYSGEVTDNVDDDHLGRIEVMVPAMFGPELKVWARPCQPYGHFFVPPVGAKVWIEFEGGHTGFPLWVGTWYPEGDVPKEGAVSPPDNRVIQTASGHTIEIMDKKDKEKIVIRHKSNAFVSIDKNGSVLLANKNGSHLFLDADGKTVTLMQEGGNLLAMKGESVVAVNKAGSTLEIKSDKIRLIANGTVQFSAKDVLLSSSTVSLGNGAEQPPGEAAVLGTTFAMMWNSFIASYSAHTHATGVGPSGPPTPPLAPPPILAPGKGLSKAVKVV